MSAHPANTNWTARGFKKSTQGNEEATAASTSITSNRPASNTYQKSSQARNPAPRHEPRGQKRALQHRFEGQVQQHKRPKPVKTEPETEPQVKTEGTTEMEDRKSNNHPSGKPAKKKNSGQKKYVLFVGNLPYDASKEDLQAHFAKAGTFKSIRMPVTKGDNKPRGFAYVEFEDHVSFEKALSLHHSFLKKRRINVECTLAGSKASKHRMSIIKDKTLKLRHLSEEGILHSATKPKKKAIVKPVVKSEEK